MKRVIYSKELRLTNTCIVIGKFDGIHKGHTMLMDWMMRKKAQGRILVVFTFQKVYDGVLNKDNHKFLLEDDEKYSIYENKGIDYVIECPVTREIMLMDKESFLSEVLVKQLGMKEIVCGSDFRFAHNREGDVSYLTEESDKYGYEIKVFEKLKDNEEIISSTRIRKLIQEGNIVEANKLLNHPYKIKGKVVHGNEIGRTLNYPTANIIPSEDRILPKRGVYFTKTSYNGNIYDSITNIGKRPTVTDKEDIVIETYILDFEGDIYDEEIEIFFYMFHRDEKKFASFDELVFTLNEDTMKRRENTRYF